MNKFSVFVIVALFSSTSCSGGDTEIASAVVPGIDIAEEERAQILEAVFLRYSKDRRQVVLLLDTQRLDDGVILIDAKKRSSEFVFPFIWPFTRHKYSDCQIRVVSNWKSRDDAVTVVVSHFGSNPVRTHIYSLQRDPVKWVLVEDDNDWLMLPEITGCFEYE